MKENNHTKGTILLVDDDPDNLGILANCLGAAGFKILLSQDGESALQQAETEQPDIILLDAIMPGMDGFETCRRLKGNENTQDIPVIFLTALSETVDEVQGFQVGGADYITKPFRQETVLARVNARLTIRQQQQQIREQNAHLRELNTSLAAEHGLLTERVQARTVELSAANAELSRALRLKDEFLATMSHELRTPLNTILGMSEALQEEVYGILNDKQSGALRRIEEGGHRLLALVTDILELSQISAGKVELDMALIAVETVCQKSLQGIKQQAQKKCVNVSFTLDPNVTMIHADGRRLQQILDKLLDNAVKFTPEGGTIGLDVTGDAENRTVFFTVWDTGIGMASEDLERLFQPFVQLDARLSRKYEGAGLGLALVYQMAAMHAGSVSVESEVGKGSRFTVTLPLKD